VIPSYFFRNIFDSAGWREKKDGFFTLQWLKKHHGDHTICPRESGLYSIHTSCKFFVVVLRKKKGKKKRIVMRVYVTREVRDTN
jgi:hypothetical protein